MSCEADESGRRCAKHGGLPIYPMREACAEGLASTPTVVATGPVTHLSVKVDGELVIDRRVVAASAKRLIE